MFFKVSWEIIVYSLLFYHILLILGRPSFETTLFKHLVTKHVNHTVT